MTDCVNWKAEAVRLKSAGKGPKEIARCLGVNYHTLRSYLERQATQQCAALGRGVRRHEIRIPRKPSVDTMALAREFVAGAIDRAELSRRLRGGA